MVASETIRAQLKLSESSAPIPVYSAQALINPPTLPSNCPIFSQASRLLFARIAACAGLPTGRGVTSSVVQLSSGTSYAMHTLQ